MNGKLLPIKHTGRFNDLRGLTFGGLTVLSEHSRSRHNSVRWLCICVCQKQHIADAQAIRSGQVKSCGCLKGQFISKSKLRHGCAVSNNWTRAYKSWACMMSRCKYKTKHKLVRYNGVQVCRRWWKFERFLDDMGEPPSEHHSLDRFPNNAGNYEPGNCRWATPTEQARNTRRNRLITFRGETLCVSEWAEKLQINSKSIHSRLEDGWSDQDAISVPFRKFRARQRGEAMIVPV